LVLRGPLRDLVGNLAVAARPDEAGARLAGKLRVSLDAQVLAAILPLLLLGIPLVAVRAPRRVFAIFAAALVSVNVAVALHARLSRPAPISPTRRRSIASRSAGSSSRPSLQKSKASRSWPRRARAARSSTAGRGSPLGRSPSSPRKSPASRRVLSRAGSRGSR